MNFSPFLYLQLLILVAPATALGQSLADQVDDCGRLQDDQARLACFDRLVAGPTTQANAATTLAVPVVTESEPVAEDELDSAAVDDFGQEHMVKDAPAQIQSAVSQVRRNGYGRLVLTLDNDQVWQQSGNERLFIDAGDQIVIRRGALSAFYLSVGSNARRYRFARLD